MISDHIFGDFLFRHVLFCFEMVKLIQRDILAVNMTMNNEFISAANLEEIRDTKYDTSIFLINL